MNGAEARILTWLASLGLAPEAVIALRGDVSPRRYFRLVGVEAVVAVYPPEQAEQSSRFLETSRLFEASGVRVPRILQADTASGLLLLEDLGDVSLFDLGHRPWQSLSGWYREAIGIAVALGGCPAADFANINPPLDARRLETELVGAQEAFLGEPEFGGSLEEREAVELALVRLCEAFEREPLVPGHRDFMSRNLMLSRNESALIVIDHQDACLTPRFYDLASLLNDSFFPSARREMDLLGPVLRDAETAAAYRRCAVQRTLKACATFIRFADRGYTRYLRLVAPTLGRAALHFERIAEGAGIPESVFARWRNPAVISAGLERITSRSKPHARAPLGSP